MLIFLMLTLLAAGLLFVGCAPQLGAAGSGERLLSSANFRAGKFRNLTETGVSASTGEMFKATLEYFTGVQKREPDTPLPSLPVALELIAKTKELRVTWFGHSTCLIEIDGRTILTDPIFSDRASPFAFMGPKRFNSEPPLTLEEVPPLDAVLISHDHYDHLDHRSILALKEKVKRFYVPLGVGGHLKRWGVPSGKIVELDWWEKRIDDGLGFTATPARHFSGRGLIRDKTLWASWVIEGKTEKVFFGGDSGYFAGFNEIGERFGPFDITLLESGAYNQAWADIHMLPEQTVLAHLDLKGKLLLPIHWGKFNLALHSWTEPIERLQQAAEARQAKVATPLIGESVRVGSVIPQQRWWKEVEPLVAMESAAR